MVLAGGSGPVRACEISLTGMSAIVCGIVMELALAELLTLPYTDVYERSRGLLSWDSCHEV